MKHLEAHKRALYELRFSPMCKPATEVANLTQLESHTVRARTMMLWRIAWGIIDWGPREAELLYESTLDSISCAFDVFHYPIHQYMLDARADIWEAGLAPENVKQAVGRDAASEAGDCPESDILLLAGEVAQLGDDALLGPMEAALRAAAVDSATWVAPTGALSYALGAWDVAEAQARRVADGIHGGGARTVIADGPETAWALTRIYAALGIEMPDDVTVVLLSEVLADHLTPGERDLGVVFVHDSRPAYLISAEEPLHTAILPGYTEDELTFGKGPVYEAPRRLLGAMGAERVHGTWTRALAKTCGADDGLWLTHPDLARGLAAQRLDHAEHLGATIVVTDSPLAAAWLAKHAAEREVEVKLLSELFV